jgi:hypothetical protein
MVRHGDGPTRRLRRAVFGGFRRDSVLPALASLEAQLDRMSEALDRVGQDRERLSVTLKETRSELEAERERGEQLAFQAEVRGAEIEAAARTAATRIVAEAEEQADRLRHDGSLRIRDVADRLEDLLRVRDQLLGELRGILDAYSGLLAEAEGRPLAEAEPPAPTPLPKLLPSPVDAGLYPRQVELYAGPFADFAELAAFERSLTRLPKVEDVHIRQFGGDRAEIELTLSEETPLVHDLTAHLPYAMDVRPDEENGHLVVEVEGAA